MKKRIFFSIIALIASTLFAAAVEVNLNFYADGRKIHTQSVEADATYTLSTIISDAGINMSDYECREWSFLGWTQMHPEEEVTDVAPELVTSVTPIANVNLYAVYRQQTGTEFKYVKISGQDALVSGDYIITYADGSDNYYALGMTEYQSSYQWHDGSKYHYYFAIKPKLISNISHDKDQIDLSQPDSVVWQYTKSDTYTGVWKNKSNSQYLYPDSVYYNSPGSKYYYCDLLKSSSNTAVTQYSSTRNKYGIFANPGGGSITNNVYYSSNEFRCEHRATNTYFPILHLFKKTELPVYEYTSYPDCSRWKVYLDAGLGTIGSGTSHVDSLQEASSGATVTLPTATEGDADDCNMWDFYGWHRNTPVETTTSAPTVYNGAGYEISHDREKLYAVYTRNAYYKKISSISELSDGDECVVVYTGNSKAVTYPSSNHEWDGTTVDTSNDRITVAVSDNIKWTYNSSDNCFYHSSTPLGYSSSYKYAIGNNDSPFKLHYTYWGKTYYLRWNGSKFEDGSTDTYNTFAIYKKVAKTYSSFPHCHPYAVTLHACGGYMTYDAKEVITKQLTEETAGAGVTIPSATPRCPEDGWSFVGWVAGDDLGSLRQTEMTAQDGLILPGTYIPTHDGAHLYAVYKRPTDYYRIVSYPNDMVAGDQYILTYYTSMSGDDDNLYDVELTSEVVSTNYLKGDPKEAPQDAEGYYMKEANAKALWVLGGSNNAWTFQNVSNNKYLRSSYSYYDDIWTNGTPSTYTITRPDESSLNLTIKDNTSIRYIMFDGGKFIASGSSNSLCFLYRQMKEFTSWPHCDPFTVNFDGCGGTAGYDSKTEDAPYAGVILPNAYVNGDCSHEDWEFIGWSEKPVDVETTVLTQNLMPAGLQYVPVKNNSTLYAVYYKKENTYAKITSTSALYLGVSYIIASTGNKAMLNVPKNTNYIDVQAVSPADGVITLEDADALEWRLQGADGVYELYNVKRDVFLDLRTNGEALLTRSAAEDDFQIMRGSSAGDFVVRSNKSIVSSQTGKKYLHYDASNTRFDSETESVATANPLYLYQRQATYNSYPSCVDPIEPLRWTDDNHVIMESFVLTGTPELSGGLGSAVSQPDGTYSLSYNPSILTPCSQTMVSWGDGTSAYIHVPWIVQDENAVMSDLSVDDCATCDAVILPGATLTIDENKTMHNITVYEGGTLHIKDNVTLTLNTLTMRCDDDTKAPQVTFGGENARLHLKYDEMYYDIRVDDKRYYWIALPFDTYVQSISFSNEAANGMLPEYRTDYWVKYYDGASRAADVNAGRTLKKSYWAHIAPKGQNALMPAGQGYNVCIADQAPTQPDGRYHEKRVLRFTMHPNDDMWNEQEYSSGKVTDVIPSSVSDEAKRNNAGWNLIGNPYLKNYNTGTVTGLRNGAWEHETNAHGDWTGRWKQTEGTTSVPYFTIFDPSTETYSQVLASERTLLPFSAVFVQIENGDQINFADDMSGTTKAPYRRAAETDAPLFTGIVLEGNTYADKTGIVLDERFTPAYEIGGDLEKIINSGRLNLYTLNANGQALAFNGLSDEDAVAPIPVGVTFPQRGEYTFAFDAERFSINALDSLILIDYMADSLETNLLYSNYTFETEAGTVNNRFAIVVRRAAEQMDITTDIHAVESDEQGATGAVYKFIRHGKLYIKYGDKIFDASGVQVR